MTQTLGCLASLILVVSGGASFANARGRSARHITPAPAVAAASRKSCLVGNIGASRFAEPAAFLAEPRSAPPQKLPQRSI
jgi:hypothetical protein